MVKIHTAIQTETISITQTADMRHTHIEWAEGGTGHCVRWGFGEFLNYPVRQDTLLCEYYRSRVNDGDIQTGHSYSRITEVGDYNDYDMIRVWKKACMIATLYEITLPETPEWFREQEQEVPRE